MIPQIGISAADLLNPVKNEMIRRGTCLHTPVTFRGSKIHARHAPASILFTPRQPTRPAIEPSHQATELRSRAKTILRSEPLSRDPSHDPTKPSRDRSPQAKIQATEPLSQDPSHRAKIRAKSS
uniref:Uncharacterized protein n=1 Tax=Fagus sylvatica TaxID=28930 RepID=A0A2N9IPU4_FAGSY